MSEFIYCPYCGAKNASTNKFCENCGQKLFETTDNTKTEVISGFPSYENQINQGFMGGSVSSVNPSGTFNNQPQFNNNASYKPYQPPVASSGSYDAMRTYQPPKEDKSLSIVKTIFAILFLVFFGIPLLVFILIVLVAVL